MGTHTHSCTRGCDDLSGLVSLLIHLAPSNSHPLTEADISCLNRNLAECVVLIPKLKIFIPHFWRCNVHVKQSEDSGVPLCPLIIHQFVVICVVFLFLFVWRCQTLCHLPILSLSLWVSFDVVGGERRAFLNFCQFMLKTQACTTVQQLGEITGFSKVF